MNVKVLFKYISLCKAIGVNPTFPGLNEFSRCYFYM